MYDEMVKQKARSIELKITLVILTIAILNVIAFSLLGVPSEGLTGALVGLPTVAFIYGGCILASTLFIFLKKAQLVKDVFYLLLSYMTFHIVLNLLYLIISKKINDNGLAILTDAMFIWITSILVFSLWYWMVDRGGPVARAHDSAEERYDLLFPQYQSSIPKWDNWKPMFLDYVFFAFFTGTGFSPADTLPLSKRMKFIMMIEAAISLIIIGMVVSRAVSLI